MTERITRTLPTSAMNTIRTTQRTFNLICSFVKICTSCFPNYRNYEAQWRSTFQSRTIFFCFNLFIRRLTFKTQVFLKFFFVIYLIFFIFKINFHFLRHIEVSSVEITVSISILCLKRLYESFVCGNLGWFEFWNSSIVFHVILNQE